jgi:plasmid replication initiation protein
MKHRYKELGRLSLAHRLAGYGNIHVGCAALRTRHARKANGTATNLKRKLSMKAKSSRFDSLVARYYPAVYSFASRLTDDPREAIMLTRDAFNSTRTQLRNRRDEAVLASILIAAVIRAGLASA